MLPSPHPELLSCFTKRPTSYGDLVPLRYLTKRWWDLLVRLLSFRWLSSLDSASLVSSSQKAHRVLMSLLLLKRIQKASNHHICHQFYFLYLNCIYLEVVLVACFYAVGPNGDYSWKRAAKNTSCQSLFLYYKCIKLYLCALVATDKYYNNVYTHKQKWWSDPGDTEQEKGETDILYSSGSQEQAAAGIMSWFHPGVVLIQFWGQNLYTEGVLKHKWLKNVLKNQ